MKCLIVNIHNTVILGDSGTDIGKVKPDVRDKKKLYTLGLKV